MRFLCLVLVFVLAFTSTAQAQQSVYVADYTNADISGWDSTNGGTILVPYNLSSGPAAGTLGNSFNLPYQGTLSGIAGTGYVIPVSTFSNELTFRPNDLGPRPTIGSQFSAVFTLGPPPTPGAGFSFAGSNVKQFFSGFTGSTSNVIAQLQSPYATVDHGQSASYVWDVSVGGLGNTIINSPRYDSRGVTFDAGFPSNDPMTQTYIAFTSVNNNTAPTAVAGVDQTVNGGDNVALTGTASSDAENDPLTYQWTQIAGPAVTLTGATTATPSFTAPGIATTTTLTFSLIVNDGTVDSVADTVDITVLENVAPSVAITGVPAIANAPFTATFTFSETVSSFDVSDLVLGNATASNFAGSGTTFTALITPTNDGVVTIDVPAASAQDTAGNENSAAVQATTNFDASAPQVVLSGVPASVRGPFDVTITFDEDVTGFTLTDLQVTNGTASNLVATSGQVYTVTITPIAQGNVTLNVDAGAATDGAGNPSMASNTVTTEYIDEAFVRTRTLGVINNFMARRADQITLSDPNLARRLLDQDTGGRLSGSAERRNANISFTGNASGEDVGLAKVVGADEAAKVNMWAELSHTSISGETADNDLTIVHAGVDYRISEDTLLGVSGQLDWADESDGTQEFDVSGQGWMVGPYVVSRLGDNIVVDGRAAIGASSNEVSPFQTYTDDFDTDRWLLKGTVTGDFQAGDWNVYPSIAVIYYEETQKGYTDSLNIAIPEQTLNLGRVTFGPRISKSFKVSNGTRLVPSAGITGVYDFETANIVNLNSGLSAGTEDLRARTEAGLSIHLEGGTNFSIEGFYDGIGAQNFEAYGARAEIRKSF